MQFIFNSDNALWSLERFLGNSVHFGTDKGTKSSTTKEKTNASKLYLRSIRLTTGLLLFRKVGHFEDVNIFSESVWQIALF